MKNDQCPICKTRCEEIMIGEDPSYTYDDFLEIKDKLAKDKEDPNVYYENAKVKAAGTKLRALQCMIANCNPGYHFHTLEELKRHLELEH